MTGRSLIPLFNPTHDQDAYSALIMGMIGRLVTGRPGITSVDVDAWMADLRERGADDDYLFSVNRYCFVAAAE
ncbi:hypothetical protein [Pseudonocardia asaccharolytica]|uniref:Uncharacterized protein n=1 Tax=Pseudonocardia asaccharolytica DSM 44247 = NBRC 16224 TaxID=1123024 RepID=A0A511D6Y8_9PSEU|nr:hypothetical protein [Pseudonocardia asaccharolytica]GEL20556.1 hypothetical protein PA7_43930 [Pseudonocardia asaccharolytica DSM 44247 = NBRC 16224]